MGDTITLPVTIGSSNYSNATVNVVITLTNKSDAGVSITGVPTGAVTYGDADLTLTGSVTAAGTGTGSWTWTTSDDTVFQITPNGATATVKILKTGSATITAKYESDTTIGSETTSSITVDKKALTVKASDKSIKVGEEVPDLSNPVQNTDYTVTGLVGTDTLTGLNLAYSATPDNTKAGTYDIIASGASAGGNYEISYENGTLTISKTPAPVPTPAPATATASVTVNSKTVSASTLAAAYAKAGVNPDSVATVVLGKKVKKIKKGSFQNLRNANTLVVKSKKLTKARVKGSLKGSSITKVKVNVGKKKTNKKYVKRYKKIFTKKNCGKKVSVTR